MLSAQTVAPLVIEDADTIWSRQFFLKLQRRESEGNGSSPVRAKHKQFEENWRQSQQPRAADALMCATARRSSNSQSNCGAVAHTPLQPSSPSPPPLDVTVQLDTVPPCLRRTNTSSPPSSRVMDPFALEPFLLWSSVCHEHPSERTAWTGHVHDLFH